MKARLAAALTTSALLFAAGCTGSSGSETGATTPSSGASAASAEPTGTTTSGGAATSSPSASPTATATATTPAPEGAVSPERADREATRALTAMGQAQGRHGKAAGKARRAAWTGVGLRAAKGDAKVARQRAGSSGDQVLSPVRPTVLAVSRGADRPAYLVVQTEPADRETPVVHLMRSGKKGKQANTFRIEESAAMLPGTSITSFDPVETGSVTATGKGSDKTAKRALRGLAVKPKRLLADYTRYLSYPRKKVADRPFTDDHFAGSVRAGAQEQAHEVRTQADFAQTHKVVPGSVVTVQQQNGGALVFAALERHDDFDIKPGQTVKPTKAFQVFAPDQQKIEISARLTTLEFVVFQVPARSGRATLIAASEHLVGGKGH